MTRRYAFKNIPMEILRSLVVIDDVGSFTKAASVLRMTQPAISAQVKRLEKFVGGRLFTKSGGGLRLTEQGAIVVGYARRIISMNDQLLALAGLDPRSQGIRIGLPRGIDQEFVIEVINGLSTVLGGAPVHIRCANSEDLVRSLVTGHLDLAFIVHPRSPPPLAVKEWLEQPHWIRSPEFLLPSNALVPLVSWPDGLSDRIAIEAFQRSGTKYSIAFVGEGRGVCTAAIMAGLGVMVATERSVKRSNLHIARDFYLPPLTKIRGGIYAREGIELDQVSNIVRVMETILRPSDASE